MLQPHLILLLSVICWIHFSSITIGFSNKTRGIDGSKQNVGRQCGLIHDLTTCCHSKKLNHQASLRFWWKQQRTGREEEEDCKCFLLRKTVQELDTRLNWYRERRQRTREREIERRNWFYCCIWGACNRIHEALYIELN